MLDSVMLFRTLAVVPLIHGSYQISGDPSDPFESDVTFSFGSSALRAYVVDDTGISAARVTVYGMVYRTIADAVFLHASDDFLKCVKVLHGIAVKLDV